MVALYGNGEYLDVGCHHTDKISEEKMTTCSKCDKTIRSHNKSGLCYYHSNKVLRSHNKTKKIKNEEQERGENEKK